jgi:DNA (cytosine-5)-methyltransferase 1
VVNYHQQLIQGKRVSIKSPPAQLRRLTIDEAIVLQTFPKTYNFSGKGSAVYRQIGNAVPPKLAKAVALVARKFI